MQQSHRLYLLLLFLLANTFSIFAVDVNLYFHADGQLISSVPVEASPASPHALNTLVDEREVTTCRGWEFLGWTLDEPSDGESQTPPALIESISPVANIDIYAVYRMTVDSTDNYFKISGQDALVTGDYIIAYNDGVNCNAIGMTEYTSTANDDYMAVYKRQITAISDDKTHITEIQPDSIIWHYSSGTWKNNSNEKNLAPYYTGYIFYTYHLFSEKSPTTTYYEGTDAFGIYYHQNTWYSNYIYNVSYNNAGEFVCSYNSDNTYIPFLHLYQKRRVPVFSYTFSPDCSRRHVYLDAGLGTVGDTRQHLDTVIEPLGGGTVTLPDATEGDEFSCDQWSFYGWHLNTPVETTRTAPTVHKGEGYTISYDGETLYSVYVKSSGNRDVVYSSFPHCRPYSITLHAGSGTIKTDGSPETLTLTEEIEGEGFVLPDAVAGCSEQGWSFVGWVENEPVGSLRKVDFTAGEGLLSSPYVPAHDGTQLYAVYGRLCDHYRIISYPENMVAGDNYILTYYTKITGDDSNVWDVELTSEVVNTNYLAGVPKDAPQDADGYYMVASDSAVIWRLGGSTNAWTFRNLKNGQYLRSNYAASGSSYYNYVRTNGTASTYTITRPEEGNLNLSIRDNTSRGYLYFNGSQFMLEATEHTECFLYRQMKEYASYPHCNRFTVLFDACGGTVGVESLTETQVDGGITLPFAYANNACSKEDWQFAGWAETPIESETEILKTDLHAAGTPFQPVMDNMTLYAVYCRKEHSYTKLTSLDDLRLGLGYIIATNTNQAMKAQTKNGTYTAYETVAPEAGAITMEDAGSVEWRIDGAHGEYVFFNVADSLYLDMRTAGMAILTHDGLSDNFRLSGSNGNVSVRSNMSIVNNTDGKKYLHFDSANGRFDSETQANASTIHLYKQQAAYNSYPLCLEPIEPLRWTADNHVIMESYVLTGAPRMTGGLGEARLMRDEGVYCMEYNPEVLTPGSSATVTWGDLQSSLRVPYLVTSDANASALGETECFSCDYVVLPGATLTVDADKTVHDITVYEGGTLHIAEGSTLSVHSLILRRDNDAEAPQVTFAGPTSAIDLQFGEIYYDYRMDEERYYWFSLPFNAYVQEVSYANITANGKDATYRTDYFIKYYNGAKRAADADMSRQAKSYWTHVADKNADAVLQAGQGYEIGIYNQKDSLYNGQDYHHTKRVMRFTMRPDDARWNIQEINSTKITGIEPSSCWHPLNAVHAGWNLIGNPYLHAYSTGEMNGTSGLVNGRWVKEEKDGVWTGYYVLEEGTTDVPYLTVYDPEAAAGQHYSQCLAANNTIRPFDVVFVQINEGNQIHFSAPMHTATRMPAYKRAAMEETPLYTGITLSGNRQLDRTGIVLADRFSGEYEIGADLSKVANSGCLNLYSLNAHNQQLAFNALSYEDALTPVPLGATFPADGVYTFAFDAEQYSLMPLDELLLIDYLENTTTNLLFADYECFAAEGTANGRFAILVRPAKANNTTTGIDQMENGKCTNGKYIKDGHLIIRKDNQRYNALGVRL